ncbi:unnamed protein product [Adineta ricciae]|uniref:G-protein coupled receptors family 2 profile 2 domain-containing protein n=1 Tax=Adineta ricciae TaxID=249248 RepID=A0A813TKI8_ADIRI|nr:unnamed protein product [Adineta ricciae]CAF1549706.1 unnamed protein product [Adineta ricciae]
MSAPVTTYQALLTTQSPTLPVYIITSFTVLTTTWPTMQYTSQTTALMSSQATTGSSTASSLTTGGMSTSIISTIIATSIMTTVEMTTVGIATVGTTTVGTTTVGITTVGMTTAGTTTAGITTVGTTTAGMTTVGTTTAGITTVRTTTVGITTVGTTTVGATTAGMTTVGTTTVEITIVGTTINKTAAITVTNIVPASSITTREAITSTPLTIMTSSRMTTDGMTTGGMTTGEMSVSGISTRLTSTIVTTHKMTTIMTTTSVPQHNFSLWNPDTCNSANFIKLSNNTCVPKQDAQVIGCGLVHNRSASDEYIAYGISLYISSTTNSTTARNNTCVLTPSEIDDALYNRTTTNLLINSYTSLVMIQQPHRDDDVFILGASFSRGIGGDIVDTKNKENVTRSNISAAAIVNRESLVGVTSLQVIIIDKPTDYEHADNKTNKTILSSVIVVNLERNRSSVTPLQISLYFNPLEEYQPNGSGIHLCSYLNTTTSTWNETGCSSALFSEKHNRYECTCNHTTSFALVWLPTSLETMNYTKELDAQDITSLIFQLASIICFLIILTHATATRIIQPMRSIPALNLLPLISTASSTILFIFFIALSLTVYTQTASSDQIVCFPTSIVLMFITYFLLIFMFCAKTITGYFYFLRFVRLFPQPTHRRLYLMLLLSFLIACVFVSFAIGFYIRLSDQIIRLYPYKLCWFNRPSIYYFMTIPIGLSLITNLVTISFVAKSIITHARNAATSKQISERLKRCVIVLLSSCIFQGLGWIFGPLISFVNPMAGNVLTWLFIIINGLEGVWSVILYVLIRLQRLDEHKIVSAAMELPKAIANVPKKVKGGDKVSLSSTKNLRQRESRNGSSDENHWLK